MLNSPMLGLAIGLAFFYMLLSLTVTVFQEFIAGWLSLRSRNLQRALTELLGKTNLKDFYEHPLIYPLFVGGVNESGKPKKGGPAYIPKRNFALAVLDIESRRAHPVVVATHATSAPVLAVAGGAAASSVAKMAPTPSRFAHLPEADALGERAPALELVKFFIDSNTSGSVADRINRLNYTATRTIGSISNPVVKDAADRALQAAVGEIKASLDVVETAVTGLENLFDNTMDRAAGWYKMQAQWLSLAFSLALTIILNADTFQVGKRLWQDEAWRMQVVAAAEKYVQDAAPEEKLDAICTKRADADPAIKDSAERRFAFIKDCAVSETNKTLNQLSDYPIGWPMKEDQWPTASQSFGERVGHAIRIAVGWFITALAVSLGSSFWFDLLGKIINIRMAGKRSSVPSEKEK